MRIRALLVACVLAAASILIATPAQADRFEGFTEWSPPANLGPVLNTAAEESAPAVSDDGRSLYFNRNPNLPGDNDEDLYVSTRSRRGPWGDPVPLVTINTPTSNERNATLSRDGLLMLFSAIAPAASAGSTSISPDVPTEPIIRAGRRR
jgi:hypothetical protein